MAAKQLKVSSFYGDKIARPYVVLDAEGKPVQDRVDAPQVNDALLEWATRVPVKMGGALVKPVYDGPEPQSLKEARTDFQIFFTERYNDVLAANPALFAADCKAMLAATSVYWRERLTAEERAEYRRRATEEKQAAAAAVADAEVANPRFKAFREKMQKYKQSMHNILTAAKVNTGPLWRAQRQLNAKYRLLEERQAEAEEEQEQADDEPLAGPSKAKGKGSKARGRGGRGGNRSAAQKRLVGSDSDSELEDDEDKEAAVAAAAAMEKLMLATAKKGTKTSPAGGKKPAAGKKAATAAAKGKGKAAAKKRPEEDEEEAVVSSIDEEEEDPEEEEESPRRQRGVQRTCSGAAVLAQRVVAAAKGRKGYTGAFDLPPSQSSTPAKARGSAKSAAGANKGAAALPAKSPGKRTRGSRAAAVAQEAPAAAEGSPAKKPRRSACK
ncbi:hypothetical protein ABPG75_001963 [Micractinium tetrahymenae]